MSQKSPTPTRKVPAERAVRDIRRATQKHHSAEDKIRIVLESLRDDLEARIEAFFDHHNHRRCHESLRNLTTADVHFGRGEIILLDRESIKRETIHHRRLIRHQQAA